MTELKLYNTLTRQKEVFEPIDANNVRMYVCGPTVYDFAHIGNARPVIVFDVLNRLLRHIYGENHVTYVRNITDVDDKINARALRDFPDLPLNDAIRKVTEKTANQFHSDIKALGCLEPTHEPRATEHIDGMIKMIQVLIEKGNAYEAGGEVLFDVSSMENYGKLSNRKLEDQQAGARVATSSHKKNPGDFVLWKLSADNQPGWPSPWGTGRPGWHIECSVMSEHHLGKVFDIHGGGLDLIFPHHENEIAQSCCAHDNDKMANIWMHNGFLQVEGKKMSKSDGNFVTIQDLLETEKFGGRKWPGEVLRLAMLMTHYREPIDFSVRRLEEAEKIQKLLWRAVGEIHHKFAWGHELSDELSTILDDLSFSKTLKTMIKIANTKNYSDDSIPRLAGLMGLLGLLSPPIQEIFDLGRDGFGKLLQEHLQKASLEFDKTLGYAFGKEATLAKIINRRLTHLTNKDWAAADTIRDELLANDIQLKDGKDPDTGERTTTWEVKR